MFWMYCPVKAAGTPFLHIPPNLGWVDPILSAACADFARERDLFDHYVYITAKTLYVHGDYIGNRPGWHIDGFGTDDVNYIWCDRAPTEFQHINPPRKLSSDCDKSMRQMKHWQEYAIHHPGAVKIVTYPDKHLLRLDNKVIHRSPTEFAPGMRSFVKVSISKDRYDLIGNSINHDIPEMMPTAERRPERNHPSSSQAA